MKFWKPEEIRKRINEVLPEGKVIPRHNEKGHFYEVKRDEIPGVDWAVDAHPVYPSVTGKLQILKDDGLINYKMNRALDYVFSNFKKFDDVNIMEHIDLASRVSQDVLMDAGDIGTRIHNFREAIFNKWIETGKRPEDFLSFVPEEEEDIRVTSALRALQKFCIEQDYIPVKCELLVYSQKLKTAGTLDDLGLMRKIIREGNPDCDHMNQTLSGKMESWILEDQKGIHRCFKCSLKYRYEFVLMDLKTSNQFKDHYFFQVALYWWKLWNLLGKEWKPERCFILKVSKEDGSYKIEDLKQPLKIANYAMAMLKTNEAVEFIKSLRKDNQRKIISL